MELTPEQLAALNALPGLTKQVEELKVVSAKVPELETQIKAKDVLIAELQKSTNDLKSTGALGSLKTAYPDVPEATLSATLSMTPEVRDSILKPVQEKAAQFKVTMAKNDATSAWADAGSIGPSTEAERAAKNAEARAAYEAKRKNGDVLGMISERAAEIAAHVRKSLVPTSR
jgi:hypothetical protein